MSRLFGSAWWQLLRAGNVFTAISNILAGYLLARGEWLPILPLILLILCSSALYLAGMVLNDVFDLEIDRVERPERPIPSGRIDKNLATIVGCVLMLDGLSAAALAAWLLKSWLPIIAAVLLTVAILAYDAWLKNTKLSPLSMGLCRSLNILLGASVGSLAPLLDGETDYTPACFYAIAIGVYTIGLTLLARNEADRSSKRDLLAANVVTQLGMLLVVLSPTTGLELSDFFWLGIWMILAVLIQLSFQQAISSCSSRSVQKSVSHLITMFIPLDALICAANGGWLTALAVLSLLLPTYIATRRAPMT